MKRFYLLILLTVTAVGVRAQSMQSDTITNDAGTIVYEYYLDQSGQRVPHGAFLFKYDYNEVVSGAKMSFNSSVKGRFLNGMRDGAWIYEAKVVDFGSGDYATGSYRKVENYLEGDAHGEWSFTKSLRVRTKNYTATGWSWSPYKSDNFSTKIIFKMNQPTGKFINPGNNATYTICNNGLVTEYTVAGNKTLFENNVHADPAVSHLQAQIADLRGDALTDFCEENQCHVRFSNISEHLEGFTIFDEMFTIFQFNPKPLGDEGMDFTGKKFHTKTYPHIHLGGTPVLYITPEKRNFFVPLSEILNEGESIRTLVDEYFESGYEEPVMERIDEKMGHRLTECCRKVNAELPDSVTKYDHVLLRRVAKVELMKALVEEHNSFVTLKGQIDPLLNEIVMLGEAVRKSNSNFNIAAKILTDIPYMSLNFNIKLNPDRSRPDWHLDRWGNTGIYLKFAESEAFQGRYESLTRQIPLEESMYTPEFLTEAQAVHAKLSEMLAAPADMTPLEAEKIITNITGLISYVDNLPTDSKGEKDITPMQDAIYTSIKEHNYYSVDEVLKWTRNVSRTIEKFSMMTKKGFESTYEIKTGKMPKEVLMQKLIELAQ